MPIVEGNVVYHDDTEWEALVSHLNEQHRQTFNPADVDYTMCGREIPTASKEAEAFPAAYYRLKEAALRGDVALAKTIYEEEWLPHTTTERFSNSDLYCIFCEALEAGHTPVVAFLLSKSVPFRKHHPELAVEKGMGSLLPIFLEHGWEINSTLAPNCTSLIVRALDNRPLCEWFLSHGADPNVQCTYGWTPLTTAVESASREVIDLLFEYDGSIEHGQLIHAAARRKLPDCLEVIQMLLDKGCDINTTQYHNHELSSGHWNIYMALGTPLHMAAGKGRVDIVKFLLDHGADARLRDSWGFLPIDKAKDKNHTEVVELLRSSSHSRPEAMSSL